MQLTQALLQSFCAEAIVNGSSILVERFTDEPFSCQCFNYDVHPAGHDRYHKMLYGDIADVLADIYENDDYATFEDGQLEQADWQPTEKRIDVSDCTCGYCEDFCLSYHIIPAWYPWHLIAWYRCKWSVQSLLRSLRIRWYLMRDHIQRSQALRRLDGEPEECASDEEQS
jgi:hypothetical protein